MSGRKKQGGGDIFSRLTDPKGYTGAHKHRFDESGRGRGREGRLDLVDNDGYVTGAGVKKKSAAGVPGRRRASPGGRRGTSSRGGASPRGRVGRDAGGAPRASGRTGGSARKKAPPAGGSRASDITARLTDPSGYTGAHKHRFDPTTGAGRGKAGRTDVVENDGYVSSFSSKKKRGSGRRGRGRGRGGARSSPSSRASDITARLTDPSGYTGAHKERFDAQGRGRGRAGRTDDAITQNDGYVGAFRKEKQRGVSKRVGSKASDITSRLTDPSGYTGAHKHRFDPTTGAGRGKAGRTDVVENDGYVSSFSAKKKRGGSRTRGSPRRR